MAKADQVHASCQTTTATIQQPVKVNEVETLFCYYFILNPFAPEPPVTARSDPGPFYPL